jgi:hypothetical protein
VDAANRGYKNSVFLLLFGRDPALIRELCGALEGVELPPDTPVVINTLEGVLYMAMLNGLSFILADRLVWPFQRAEWPGVLPLPKLPKFSGGKNIRLHSQQHHQRSTSCET